MSSKNRRAEQNAKGNGGRRGGGEQGLLKNYLIITVFACLWHSVGRGMGEGVGVACLHIKCLIIYEGKIVKKQSLSAENF